MRKSFTYKLTLMTLFLKDGILILYQIEQLSFNYILDNCFVDMYNFWFHFLS